MSRLLLLCTVLLAGPLAAQDAAPEAPRYEAWELPGALPLSTSADSVTVMRPVDPWLGRDKALHVGASFLLTLSGQYMLVNKLDATEGEAWPLSATGALAVGLLKEIADSRRARNPLFSWRDLAADAVGVGLGLGLIWL
ncbi:MAG: hypothetical protein AAFN13_12845 [Bacteroidota bacterium]